MPDLTASTLAAAVLGAVCVAVAGWCGPWVVARLPEPALESDREGKPPYAEVAARPGLSPLLAGVGAVAGAGAGYALGLTPVLVSWVVLGAAGVWLGFVDLAVRLLPTAIITPTYVAVVGTCLLDAAVTAQVGDLLRAVLGWAVMGGFYLVSWFVYPRGIGYGDVRLSGVLGLALGYLGWPQLVVGLYAAFVLGALVGVASVLVRRGRTYPFGPCMLTGAWAGVLWGAVLTGWYVG